MSYQTGVGFPNPPRPNQVIPGDNSSPNINTPATDVSVRERVLFSRTDIDMSVVFDSVKYNLNGNGVWIPSATSGALSIDVQLDGTDNGRIPASSGFFLVGSYFGQLYLSNLTAGAAGDKITLITFYDPAASQIRLV